MHAFHFFFDCNAHICISICFIINHANHVLLLYSIWTSVLKKWGSIIGVGSTCNDVFVFQMSYQNCILMFIFDTVCCRFDFFNYQMMSHFKMDAETVHDMFYHAYFIVFHGCRNCTWSVFFSVAFHGWCESWYVFVAGPCLFPSFIFCVIGIL